MQWIYLSPHLDDAVFSCGGLIHRQIRQGDQVTIWTICAGEPPLEPFSPFAEGQHTKWNLGPDASSIRRKEDRRACASLRASWRHLPVPDCIYRRSPVDGNPMYASEEAIFGPLDPAEKPLIAELVTELVQTIPRDAQVVCPLGVGGHVDHRLTVSVAKDLARSLWFYAEIPYVNREPSWIGGASPLLQDSGWKAHLFQLGSEDLSAWQDAVAAYVSQLRVFWPSRIAMRFGLKTYLEEVGGGRLWRQFLDEM